MKNCIFLDIDGVLQPFDNQERFNNDLDALQTKFMVEIHPDYAEMDKFDIGAVYLDWDKESVNLLEKLIEATDSQIVISSSWRCSKTLQQLQQIFRIYQLDKYIIDTTPIFDTQPRAYEIKAYLDTHPEVGNFVILDDDACYFREILKENFVKCPGKFGEKEYQKALRILQIRNSIFSSKNNSA